MHWGAVGAGLLVAGGIWLAAQAVNRRRGAHPAQAVEADPAPPPEPTEPAHRRAWPNFVGPLLALALGLALLVAGRA